MIYEVWTVEKKPRIVHGAIYPFAMAETLASALRDAMGIPATVRRARRPFTLKPEGNRPRDRA